MTCRSPKALPPFPGAQVQVIIPEAMLPGDRRSR